MKPTSIGFIGGGRVARILLQGWKHARCVPSRIVVADPNSTALASLHERFPTVEVTANLRTAAASEVVLLAVPPPAIAAVAAEISSALTSAAILVSLAPKFTIGRLSELRGGFSRIARANPNAASVVGLGHNPIAFGPALTSEDRQTIRGLFAPLGESPEIAEEKIEAYAVFTAMGPTYLWFQLQTLRELAQSFGLTAAEADVGLKRMACGAVQTLTESGLRPAEVMDLVPVKPLAEFEPTIAGFYRERLPALFEKIRP